MSGELRVTVSPEIAKARAAKVYHTAVTTTAAHVVHEACDAFERFGDMASMHEGWGVLAEEFDELTEAIRQKQSDPTRAGNIRHEALQVAAVALRIAESAGRVTR